MRQKDMETPILSIVIPTYNHEKYIAKALDSVLMQKTKYTFETLVGEDCSTDNTRSVLKQYEQRYPGFFTVYYREHNMYRENPSNGMDLRNRCKGKYVICLEGDDFWTDPYKLEKQISFLESHPEYYAVAHNCIVVGEDSKQLNESYPHCYDREYTYRHFFSGILPGQTATVMFRNIYKDSKIHNEDYPDIPVGTAGDQITIYKILVNGRIYCMQEVMSAYRHITTSGSSWSANYKYDFKKSAVWWRAMLTYTKKHKPEWEKYVRIKYLGNMIRGFRSGQCDLKQFWMRFRRMKLIQCLFLFIRIWIRRHILKSKILI